MAHIDVLDGVGTTPGSGHEQNLDTLESSVLEQGVDHEGDEEQVGEGGGEVDNLAAGFDSLNCAAITQSILILHTYSPLTRQRQTTVHDSSRHRVMSHLISPMLPGSVRA